MIQNKLNLSSIMDQQVQNNSKPNIKSMWGCMFAGYLALKGIQNKAIAIVGDSRMGKSTLFNYIKRNPLIGVEIQDGFDVIYEIDGKKLGVEAKATFQSVTLVPNADIVSLDEDEINLVDLAGFHDESRSYVGVFGVSFMIQTLLEKVQQIKFVLTISHSVFESQKLQSTIQPFQNFIKILKTSVLVDQQYKSAVEKLMRSVSVVVTKSRNPPKFYISRLKKAIQAISKNQISIQRRAIIMLVQSIVNDQRIQLFKKAETDLAPSECKILQNLSDPNKKWSYYNFKQQLKKEFLFELGFQRDMASLKDAQKQEYKQETEKKLNFMKKSYQLLQQILKRAVSKQFGENWLKQTIDYSQQFQEIQKIVKDHPYGSYQLMLAELQPNLYLSQNRNHTISRLNLLQELKKICQFTKKINEANTGTTTQKIKQMTLPVLQIMNICRNICCQTTEQEQLFIIFTFLNQRSLYETEMQSKVDKKQGSGIPFAILEYVLKILPETIQDLAASLLTKIHPKQHEKQLYQKLLCWILPIANQISDPTIGRQLQFSSIKSNMQNVQVLLKEENYFQALNSVIKVNQQFQNYLTLLPDPSERSQQQKALVEFKHLQIYKIIGRCLQQLKYNRFAIRIYEHIKAPYLLKKCYMRIFAQQKKMKNRYEMMEDYIQVLRTYGKKQEMISFYERMIDEFQCYPEKRKQLKMKLSALLIQDFGPKIYEYYNRLSENDQNLNDQDLIDEIKDRIAYHYDNNASDEQDNLDEAFYSREMYHEDQQVLE